MKKTMQERLALLMEARKYSEKMQKGSVFVTDFVAMGLMKEMTLVIQEMLSENLKLREQLKTQKAFKNKKERPR
tara:strand:+ start:940 stop:1161 length:222 start_codon:yes stop_codon:yes gene_type:complete